MFSGIVEEVGKVLSVEDSGQGRRLKIGAKKVTQELAIGDSVSCAGACLTVCTLSSQWFTVDATWETLRCTKVGQLKVGSPLNLERALRLSDRLGGHLVSGHVDALGSCASVRDEGFSRVIEFAVPIELSPFFVEKGSVTVDGVSLTVAKLDARGTGPSFSFSVAIIPHTLAVTTLIDLKLGDVVNIEADIVGKYVARLMSPAVAENINKAGLTLGFLSEHGYT